MDRDNRLTVGQCHASAGGKVSRCQTRPTARASNVADLPHSLPQLTAARGASIGKQVLKATPVYLENS